MNTSKNKVISMLLRDFNSQPWSEVPEPCGVGNVNAKK